MTPFISSAAPFANAREAGLTVMLVTNSPKLNDSAADQFTIDRDCSDRIVTSGDVTRKLIA